MLSDKLAIGVLMSRMRFRAAMKLRGMANSRPTVVARKASATVSMILSQVLRAFSDSRGDFAKQVAYGSPVESVEFIGVVDDNPPFAEVGAGIAGDRRLGYLGIKGGRADG